MILGLADDLTGALETAAHFAMRGLRARVTCDFGLAGRAGCDVLVINTQTRHLSEQAAEDRVYRVSREAAHICNLEMIFKKTDSTLRGHISAELRALQQALPGRSLVYAPAYPKLGRAVKNGNLYVWGKLVHETEFATDRFHPVRQSDIRLLLNSDSVHLMDGESDQDLADAACLVTRSPRPWLAAGTAAFAGSLASAITQQQPTIEIPKLACCLLVNGSLHAASIQQISIASPYFDERLRYFQECGEGVGMRRAEHLGRLVKEHLMLGNYDGVIIFGGDTAFGIHQALGALPLQVRGEILPGVVLSFCGILPLITKAGGYGGPELIRELKNLLL